MAPVGQRKMSLPPELRIKPERKLALKVALIKYATQEAAKRAAQLKEEKAKALEERVPAFPDVDSLDEEALKQLCRDLHGKRNTMTHI